MSWIFQLKDKYIIIICIVMFFFVTMSYAQEPSFDIELSVQSEFSQGNVLQFGYLISSDTEVYLEYFVGNKCADEEHSFYLYKAEPIKANLSLDGRFDSFYIGSSFKSQTCTAYVQILSPIQKTFSKNFIIVAEPSFDFNILLDKKVFIKNEDINLNFNSEVSNPLVTSILTYPDKTSKQITLPYQFKVEQIGTYTLDINATKEGYKEKILKEQFAVIEKEPDIKYINPAIKKETGKNYKLFYYLVVLFIIFAVVYLKLKRRLK